MGGQNVSTPIMHWLNNMQMWCKNAYFTFVKIWIDLYVDLADINDSINDYQINIFSSVLICCEWMTQITQISKHLWTDMAFFTILLK